MLAPRKLWFSRLCSNPQWKSGLKMTNAIDGLRAKFKMVLMRIDKDRRREMVARRKTNEALERTKTAKKKSFYLQHRLDALADKLLINSMRLERTMVSLAISKGKRSGNQNKYEEKLCQDISHLERTESEYRDNVNVLLAKRAAMIKRLEDLEKRISTTNESVKILEKRLLKLNETLRLKKMKRDLDNQRLTSRAHVLIHLRRYLELAKKRTSRAESKIERLKNVKAKIAENIKLQTNVTLQAKNEVQRIVLSRRKSSTC